MIIPGLQGLRAGIYARLSKEDLDKIDKGDDSESIKNQIAINKDFCDENGITVVAIYTDDDLSGLYDDRPDFERMLGDLMADKLDLIVSKTQSRFTRNTEHLEYYLRYVFPRINKRFIGVLDHIDTGNPATKKTSQIQGLTNEWYCEDLSQNIKSSYKTLITKEGKYLARLAPYGYLKDPDDKYHLIIDPETAPIVKRIFYMYVYEGMGAYVIAQQLTAERIMTPLQYKKMKGDYKNPREDDFSGKVAAINGHWSPASINQILNNDIYYGDLVRHKREKVSYKHRQTRKVNESEWYRYPKTHDAIVSYELFLAAKRIRKERVHRYKVVGVQSEREVVLESHILSGKIYCKNCGAKMHKGRWSCQRKDGTYAITDWLRCTTAIRTRKAECDSMNIKFSIVTDAVWKELNRISTTLLSDQDVSEINDAVYEKCISRENQHDRLEQIRKQKTAAESEIRQLEIAFASLYVDKATQAITPEEYDVVKSGLMKKKETAELRLSELAENYNVLMAKEDTRKKNREKAVNAIQEYRRTGKLTFSMMQVLVDRIDMYRPTDDPEKLQLRIEWKF